MIEFDFATPSRILFGAGSAGKLRAIAAEFGTRPLVVCGGNPARHEHLISGEFVSIKGEPSVDDVRDACAIARGCDVVIGVGGGSAIDAAKATAILATNSGEPLDYIEVIGRGVQFERPGLPFIAVPTTAGAGAEVTRNAVLSSPEHGLKASLRSPLMLAKVVVVDPELTLTLPPAPTAYTGLDALTQLIEPYVSARANAVTDMFCLTGLRLVRDALERAFADGADVEARSKMSHASLLGGLALSNAGLGVVHGFAAPLGGLLDAHHGEICAALLPWGVEANLHAIADQGRYRVIGETLGVGDLVDWLRSLTRRLGIRTLGELGLKREQIPDVVMKAERASSMKANPVQLSREQLTSILVSASA